MITEHTLINILILPALIYIYIIHIKRTAVPYKWIG